MIRPSSRRRSSSVCVWCSRTGGRWQAYRRRAFGALACLAEARSYCWRAEAERPALPPGPTSLRVHEWVLVVARRVEVFLDRPRADPSDQIELRSRLVVGARGPRAAERLLT